MVLFEWRGRGRLVLQWQRPARVLREVPLDERVRQHLLREVHANRCTVQEAEYRFERFLKRSEARADRVDTATDRR